MWMWVCSGLLWFVDGRIWLLLPSAVLTVDGEL
jgi:hypothetical protein